MRAMFLATSRVALDLLGRPEVGKAWDEPSALAEFTVRGLAGHLTRAVGSVEAYLDRDEPPADQVIDAAHYYAAALATVDITSDQHAAIRQRGEEAAAGGHGRLVQGFAAQLDRMAVRLPREAPGRRVQVFGDLVLVLDDYLLTRLIELSVHMDDLAVSVGVPPPDLPPGAYEEAIACLVDVGRARHGDLAVLRALSRRERDGVDALRVL
ncbi:MAG TPA: maleylpyruvate isomerase N-terminal domain-containing protein [Acidimicrobiales bacterium]|nr:maleylpyruvate isomerase N-terminal domain-containing protein [Acidimicrobiales bacterium]